MSGWQIAGNAAMAGLGAASGLGQLGGQAIKRLNGPINLGNGGCFVAGTKVKVDALPLSAELEAVLAGAAELRGAFAAVKPAAPAGLVIEACDLQSPVSSLQPPSTLLPIESVLLGARIGTKNPQSWDYDDSLPEPDTFSWSRIELTITRDDGVVIDVELLRPDQWILDNNVFVGSQIPIHVAELDVHGTARITNLLACQGLAAGDGEVVTGRFVTRQVAETIRITLADGTALEGTPVHPVWSVDREDFVEMSDLQPGERLQTGAGPVAVAVIETRHLPVPVYNIEVRGQHVYEVTDAAILVHNAQPCLVVGETLSTASGKSVHKSLSDTRRAEGFFDLVQQAIKNQDGSPINVARRVNLETGAARAGTRMQQAIPDAVSFRRRLIVDDKPMGRPLAKDRQELRAYPKTPVAE